MRGSTSQQANVDFLLNAFGRGGTDYLEEEKSEYIEDMDFTEDEQYNLYQRYRKS